MSCTAATASETLRSDASPGTYTQYTSIMSGLGHLSRAPAPKPRGRGNSKEDDALLPRKPDKEYGLPFGCVSQNAAWVQKKKKMQREVDSAFPHGLAAMTKGCVNVARLG